MSTHAGHPKKTASLPRAASAVRTPTLGRLPGITFNCHHIHVLRDAQERGMDDIRTCQDNHDAANFITAQVRYFSADPHCALHVSIAGGRKTMGFYLGYALSLYGRAQDRLSHVLVSDPSESSRYFFYPTPYSRVLQTKDGKLADTALEFGFVRQFFAVLAACL